jgi:type IV pilus assembly protein PilQ
MINLLSKFTRKAVLIIFLSTPIILFCGCASNKATEAKAAGNKLITDIIMSENPTSTIVTVKSNRLLTYTSLKQVFPLGLEFRFPETSLENIATVYVPPDSDTISSIKTSEIKEDGQATTARIFIALKKDVPYDINPEEAGLQIVFPKTGAVTSQAQPPASPQTTEEKKPLPPSRYKTPPPATEVKSITATPLQKNVVINVRANGVIKNYKSFTMDNPPRIVFDLFNLKTPHKTEQRVEVKSKFLKQIRYFGHPDKVRVVLDTSKAYLSKYSAIPIDSGFLIHVGEIPPTPPQEFPTKTSTQSQKPAAKSAQPEVAEKKESESPATHYDRPAWVNRIDFSSEEGGKSAVIIGTTRPVKYELIKKADKILQLTLLDTNLPQYRKHALITTRFESAVDRVTPVQTPAMKDTTSFIIDLRQTVSYDVEKTDDTIRINFAASSIPPRPYETAEPPAWKKALVETEAGPKKKAAKPEEPAKVQKGKEVKVPKPAAEKPGEAQVKQYTGEKIALDFYDTDIKNVFRILREISGKNFAIDKNVTGKVTLTLEKPVPWDQVLDLVLKMNQLGMTMEGDIIRIATLTTLAQEEKLRQAQMKAEQQSKQQAEALEPLLTEYIPVNYSNAATEVLPHVQQILTEGRGKASVDTRNNQLIITDTAAKIEQAKEIVEKIDQVTPQVIIEARVVEANSNFARDLGFDWGTVTLGQFDVGKFDIGPTTFLASNLPNATPSATLGFNIFKLSGTDFTIVNAQLQASEVEGKTNILSAPKIVTLDNKKAKIKQGFEVPYLERDSSGNATVRFKDVDLLLEVTPSITPDDRIALSIFITKNDLVDPTAPEPALSTNEAQTEILMDDGDTVVIGGILKSTKTWAESGIPGLMKLPALDWLFKSHSTSNDKNELLIFITPQIVRLEQKKL